MFEWLSEWVNHIRREGMFLCMPLCKCLIIPSHWDGWLFPNSWLFSWSHFLVYPELNPWPPFSYFNSAYPNFFLNSCDSSHITKVTQNSDQLMNYFWILDCIIYIGSTSEQGRVLLSSVWCMVNTQKIFSE